MQTVNTEYPICPHCGHANKPPQFATYLAYYEEAVEDEVCEACEKTFDILPSFKDVVYTTRLYRHDN
jgi:hypothetical protein